MKSIREIYKIGKGPSSSHTMGPQKAARMYAERHAGARSFQVTLYGSLAATGRGHMTDVAILEVLGRVAPTTIAWEPQTFLPYHPNGMRFTADGQDPWTCYSVGGGALSEGQGVIGEGSEVYPMSTLTAIMEWCRENGRAYWEYVKEYESADIWDYLMEVWQTMKQAVERGLDTEGVLPGPLGLQRKATTYYV